MAKRKKAKRQIWKKFKSKIVRRRSVVVGVITVGISVAVLAIFVPSDPAAMVTNINNNGLSLSVKAPGTVAFNKPVKFTMKIKNTSKKTINGAAIQFQPGNVVVAGSCGGCEKTAPSSAPNGLATWFVNGLKKGKTRTINVTMKFNQGGTWQLLWAVVKGNTKYQNHYINVKPPPKPDFELTTSVSGLITPTIPGQPYTYVLTVKNTGKKKMAKLNVGFDPWRNTYCEGKIITFASPKQNAITAGPGVFTTGRWTFRNVPAGGSKKITLKAVWPACYRAGDVESMHIWANTPSRSSYQVTKGVEVKF